MNNFTMDDFRAEMRRRGVYRRRVMFQAERNRNRVTEGPHAEPRRKFLIKTLSAVRARIVDLQQRSLTEVIACPWSQVEDAPPCTRDCRCGGLRVVAVELVLEHYRSLEQEIDRELR